MKHNLVQTAAQNIVPLGMAELPIIEPEAILALRSEMGPEGSQELVERAAFELSDRLWLLEAAYNEQDLDEVKRVAASLVAISEQLGLMEFSMVSQSLADCISRNDETAIHAVAARLLRVGEMSLYFAVQFQDL